MDTCAKAIRSHCAISVPARGAGLVLGELQTEAMEALRREPNLTLNEVEARLCLGALLGQIAETAVSAFVDLVGDDAEALDRLEELIREKRREKGGGPGKPKAK